MKRVLNIFLNQRFYTALFILIVLFVFGHFFSPLFVLSRVLLFALSILIIVDLFLIWQGSFSASRTVAERFSNGDYNSIKYELKSAYRIRTRVVFIDELPVQFQKRSSLINKDFAPSESHSFDYSVRPVKRGVYHFGKLHVLVSSKIGFFSMRYSIDANKDVAVYPSFIQLKKHELLAFSYNRNQQNNQLYQRPGNSREFEQIKEYVIGDDYRKLNWKATARFNKLMVNEYQEERSRHIYQLIDMGRTMKMPFSGMTLLDYAINSSLALSNIILKKQDKTGLLTYSSKVHSLIKSDNRQLQLNRILETLYAQETQFNESNLEQVFAALEKNTQGRSMLIFYTNFESNPSLERQLPLLKKMAKRHLVLLVTFINTELEELTHDSAKNMEDIYQKALANNYINNKYALMEELTHHGILNISVRPDELTISVINKYLEVKDRGLI
ncbi:DUF58 domain-containing protein [Saccharicrinis aurantiacus]|uniref:DUF58 domain-containing protein n=1 Tax=Saccharicrinis aurantiacus TaxID=1849719 RepID=UPI00249353EC|nr:DUF58 domain-containing protein [Saccharicrinis aurantiacus]